MPPGSSSCRERIIFASMQDSNVCDKTLEHPGMALPLSLWRRESDLLLLTVRAPDKRASSRLVRVLDSALLPASAALVSRDLHGRTDQQYHGRNRARVNLFVACAQGAVARAVRARPAELSCRRKPFLL